MEERLRGEPQAQALEFHHKPFPSFFLDRPNLPHHRSVLTAGKPRFLIGDLRRLGSREDPELGGSRSGKEGVIFPLVGEGTGRDREGVGESPGEEPLGEILSGRAENPHEEPTIVVVRLLPADPPPKSLPILLEEPLRFP